MARLRPALVRDIITLAWLYAGRDAARPRKGASTCPCWGSRGTLLGMTLLLAALTGGRTPQKLLAGYPCSTLPFSYYSCVPSKETQSKFWNNIHLLLLCSTEFVQILYFLIFFVKNFISIFFQCTLWLILTSKNNFLSGFIYAATLKKIQVTDTDKILGKTAAATIFPPVWRFFKRNIQHYKVTVTFVWIKSKH